jgi:pyruvate,water dikinase
MSRELLGMPEGFAFDMMQTINGYAYQSVGFSPGQVFWLLVRMVPSIPRLMREGVSYWQDVAHPLYAETAARWSERDVTALSPTDLLSGLNELLDAFARHLGSLMASTMGPSAGSEGLFTQVYEKMIRREGDPAAPALLMGYDSIPIKGEKALFDLAGWCRERPALAGYLLDTPAQQLVAQLDVDEAPAGVAAADWREWRERFCDHLDRYGYSIYTMDFARSLPMDEPAPILEALKLFVAGRGTNPHERQGSYAERREMATEATRARLRGFKRWAFEKTIKWAQSQAPLREDGIAEIGLGYPALRRMLVELGRRFVAGGALAEAADVYWLEGAELEQFVAELERGEALRDASEAVRGRKALWEARRRVAPPPQLPPGKKYMGIDVEIMLAASEDDQQGGVIKGVPTSAGRVTATARVLHGPEDFDQLEPGDVLVAGITTPAWTPLFALAAGVVTDVGGPMSHGSIVAREYGIPAVMGTGVATRRIRSGQTITIDGGEGTVVLAE